MTKKYRTWALVILLSAIALGYFTRESPNTKTLAIRQPNMDEATFNRRIKLWLGRVSSKEHPPAEIVAYNIGLFETKTGYMAYLIGAKHYSADNGDWASDEDFTPTEKYFAFPTDRSIIKWEKAQEMTVKAVKSFLSENAASFLNRSQAVTVGFDDGDLEQVK